MFSWSDANATHVTGGDISYSCLGNNDYEITLTVIRDCYGIPLSDSVIIDLAAPSCGLSYSTYLSKTNVQTSNVYCSSAVTACNSPSGILDWEIYTYKDTVTLVSCSDWEISWTSCCRSFAITTLTNPSAEGFYVKTLLDATLST